MMNDFALSPGLDLCFFRNGVVIDEDFAKLPLAPSRGGLDSVIKLDFGDFWL
jgi:hypothetical protein